MRVNDTDDLRARLLRNAPEVDARAGWAALHSRMAEHSGRKSGRTRRILVAGAAVCIVPALVCGALLAAATLGNRQSVVHLGEGPTVQTALGPPTTATTEFKAEFKVEAADLTSAWLKAAEAVGFAPETAYSDQLEIDYSPGTELRRVYIHAYTELGEVTARSTATPPRIELLVTLTRSGASSDQAVAPQPVLTILDAFERTGGIEAMLFKPQVKEMMVAMSKLRGEEGPGDPVYRVTTAWELSGSDEIREPGFVYVGKLGRDVHEGNDSLFELLPLAEMGKLMSSEFVHLAVTVCREGEEPAGEAASAGGYPNHVYFLLPALIQVGYESSTYSMPREAALDASAATKAIQVTISP